MKFNALLSVTCVLLFSNLNYTFPVATRRQETAVASVSIGNDSNHCPRLSRHPTNYTQNEKSLKVIESPSLPEHTLKCKNSANYINDKYNFEQLVILKKNPYLDLKEMEARLLGEGAAKSPRQAASLEPAAVEIFNRGLSGFALPTKLAKTIVPDADLTKLTVVNNDTIKVQLLTDLVKDIKKFETFKNY